MERGGAGERSGHVPLRVLGAVLCAGGQAGDLLAGRRQVLGQRPVLLAERRQTPFRRVPCALGRGQRLKLRAALAPETGDLRLQSPLGGQQRLDALIARHRELEPTFEFLRKKFDGKPDIVDANIKRHARLNTITHLLDQIPYKDLTPKKLKLPRRQKAGDYRVPDLSDFQFVPSVYPKDD